MITIIIPLYNAQSCLADLLASLLPVETACEVLLINDGSTDATAEIGRESERKYRDVRFIDKPHSGVSDTRNAGIRAAKGKYILFLDADDRLEKGSVEALARFFEDCGDAVDLVTYPIETHYRGRVLAPHFRYEFMPYSGIYDLCISPYIGQTTMNIAVRNRFEANIFFDTAMNFSEDQKYCCEVVREKMKIGFCRNAKYIYNRSESSSSGKLNGACYIFEQSMKMFEDMFHGYETVPAAFQGLYINDLAWKLRSNILYPYHYDRESFAFAMDRIRALLAKVRPEVILGHPAIDYFHKFYWLSLKPDVQVEPFFREDSFGLRLAALKEVSEEKIYSQKKFEIVLVRIRVDGGIFLFKGFVKSPLFGFTGEPEVYARVDGTQMRLNIFPSAHSYYFCRTETNRFYGFCFEFPADKLGKLSFFVRIGRFDYGCVYLFLPKSPFSHDLKRYDSVIGRRHLSYNTEKGEFWFGDRGWAEVLAGNSLGLAQDAAVVRRKAVKLKKEAVIHLYYDCRGVKKDNGYYRFLADYGKEDGITRKYIYDPENEDLSNLFTGRQQKDLIPFGSREHKIFFLAAEKIYTAYIEDINIFPFEPEEFDLYSDFFGFEVIYLQHGILHGSLPWKYTPEMIMADKVCISTVYEQRLFAEKYHFRKADLLKETMPRLKLLDKSVVPEKKILFAPSWRQYLIGPDIDGKWQPEPGLFVQSDYYHGISALLNSARLERLLEEHGYRMEFKLHPIFSVYEGLFEIRNAHVKMVREAGRIEDYEIFMTDFSSFAFDFLYLGRKVFSFIPDEMQFRSGMNSYREIEPESERMFIRLRGEEDLDRLFGQERPAGGIRFLE